MSDSIWVSQPTTLSRLTPIQARIALVLLLTLMALALGAIGAPAPPPVSGDPALHVEDRADILLYERIVEGLRNGESYYSFAANSLRTGNYPLKPFVTFRLPTLALIQSSLPPFASLLGLYGLAAAAFALWFGRLRELLRPGRPMAIGAILMLCGLGVLVKSEMVAFHEPWAGLLIAISLGCRKDDQWRAAVAFGLAAMLVRETAALYAAAMAGLALLERRPRELAGWAAALAIFTAVVAFHAHQVGLVVRLEDPASPGWAGMLGFGFLINVLRETSSLAHIPQAPAILLTGLTLFGWVAAPGTLAQRARLTVAAYAALLALFCRADTFYWGLMIAPVFLVGLVWVPDGLRDLAAAAGPRPSPA